MEYDYNGNLIHKEHLNAEGEPLESAIDLSYNYDNKMVRHTTAERVIDYHYDGSGERVGVSVDGERKSYLVDRVRKYSELLNDGDMDYVLAGRVRKIGDYYPLYDGHGSVIALSDANGDIVNSYSYTPFGTLRAQSGDVNNRYLYSGERVDSETGLQYLRARYYDISTGRFTTRDDWEGDNTQPITLNRYLYANGNPIKYVDPSGHMGLMDMMVGMNILANLYGGVFKFAGFLIIAYNVVLGIPKDNAFRGDTTPIYGVGLGGDINGFGIGVGIDILVPSNWSEYWIYGYVGISLSIDASYKLGFSGIEDWMDDLSILSEGMNTITRLRDLVYTIVSGSLAGYTGLAWGIKNSGSYSEWTYSFSLSFVKMIFGSKHTFPLAGTFFSSGKKPEGEEVYGYLVGVGGDGISISAFVGWCEHLFTIQR